MKRLLQLLFTIVLLCWTIPSAGWDGENGPYYIKVGERVQVIAPSWMVYIDDYSEVKWESDNNDILHLDHSGTGSWDSWFVNNVTCKKQFDGTLYLRLYYKKEGDSYWHWDGPISYGFRCKDGGGNIPVKKITLNHEYVNVSLSADNFLLAATIEPDNATDKSINWSSSNPKVATVELWNGYGLVKLKSIGKTIITCMAKDGSGVKATCSVEVVDVVPTYITVSPPFKTINVGESFQAIYTLTPSDATTTVTWSSSNTNIATVSSSGVVKGIKAGYAEIYATTSNGKWDGCEVTVMEGSVDPTAITISPSSKTINVGESFQASYTLTPSNATTTVTWSSDNTNIATVSSSGVVKGIKAGSTYINVKTANGKTDWFKVTVKEVTVDPTAITISPTSKTIKVGESFTPTYSLTPSNATTTVTWSSDNSSVASVDKNTGKVTGVKAGSTYINVTTSNGKTDWCKVTVEEIIFGIPIVQVEAGDSHSLILKSDGSLWACGLNKYGQLGDGTTTNRTTPVKVMSDVKSMSAGDNHSLILKNDGSLWACGYNGRGGLGDGTTTDRTSPVKVMSDVKSISAGTAYSLILKNDGSLWACGSNYCGQLGDGTTTDRTTPVKVMSDVKSISAGWLHSLILKKDGSLWVCGFNVYGQLGDGTSEDRKVLVKVMSDVKSISAGTAHSLILKNDGSLWACGSNYCGQLGDGTTTNRTTLVKVMTDVMSMSAGTAHSLILKNDGTLWVCGSNGRGQLGDGTTTDRTTPVKVMSGVKSISAGWVHSLILKNDGSIWACGDNEYGQLGDGTNIDRHTPVKIMDGINSAGIDGVLMDKPTTDNSVFSLSGQRLSAPRKGLNIIGGKKVMVK